MTRDEETRTASGPVECLFLPSLGIPVPVDCIPAILLQQQAEDIRKMLGPSIFRTKRLA